MDELFSLIKQQDRLLVVLLYESLLPRLCGGTCCRPLLISQCTCGGSPAESCDSSPHHEKVLNLMKCTSRGPPSAPLPLALEPHQALMTRRLAAAFSVNMTPPNSSPCDWCASGGACPRTSTQHSPSSHCLSIEAELSDLPDPIVDEVSQVLSIEGLFYPQILHSVEEAMGSVGERTAREKNDSVGASRIKSM